LIISGIQMMHHCSASAAYCVGKMIHTTISWTKVLLNAHLKFYLTVSVCLSVCLLTGLLKKPVTKTIWNFNEVDEVVGHNPETNRLDFEW